MNAMQKSIVWVANGWVKAHYENPRPSDYITAVHTVVKSVLFRATLEDQRIATSALLKRFGRAA
jgi:hypothetical protein